MEPCLAFAAFGVAVAIIAWFNRGHRLGGQRFTKLRDLSDEVSRTIGLPADRDAEGWYRRLDELSFSGTLADGRAAKVDFFSEAQGSSTTTYVRFFVAVAGAPTLSIRPEGFLHKLSKSFGLLREVEIGVPSFDDRYLLEAEEAVTGPVRKLLSEEMRAVIDRAFARAQPRAVRFGPTGITVEVTATSLDPSLYPGVLTALARAASLIDARRVKVKVLGGTRRLVVGPRGTPRCAYCRADVTGDEPDLVACDRCATVAHAGCWDEHGRCPIYGCEGRDPERAGRPRARG